MMDASPTAERREQILGLLAEKTFALACAVQQRALEAETSEEMARLSQAFVRLGRSVRQCIALHARLEKDRVSGEHEAADAKAQAHALAVKQRKRRLERGVEAILCADWDPEIEEGAEEAYELNRSLRERLDDLSEAENFLDIDPDQLIDQLCQELALEAARADAVLAPHKAAARAAPPDPGPTPGLRPNGHIPEPPPANTS